MTLTPEARAQLTIFQRNEITEHLIYSTLSALQPPGQNRDVLAKIAADEKRHYEEWKNLTGAEVGPDKGRAFFYIWVSRLLGFTFGVKLMERGEKATEKAYAAIPFAPEKAAQIQRDEKAHEAELLAMLDEERLRYVGSVVLGLNDALVELTGALAGLTLALQSTRLIAMVGSITGIAAAFSMAASEYLSTKTEDKGQHPLKAAVYTGFAYIMTVLLLITPYLVLANYYAALACTLSTAVLIIAAFNFYIGVARDQPFLKRFLEMAGLSLSVAALSFLVGFALRHLGGPADL